MKEIYDAVLNGDHISDHNLLEAARWFRDTADRLRLLGPNFHLTWKEAHRVASYLEEAHHSRLLRKAATVKITTEWADNCWQIIEAAKENDV